MHRHLQVTEVEDDNTVLVRCRRCDTALGSVFYANCEKLADVLERKYEEHEIDCEAEVAAIEYEAHYENEAQAARDGGAL